MRSINPATGAPYLRNRPVDWERTRSILRYRQADKKLKDAGFIRVRAFSSLPWESPDLTHTIVETAVHPDGMGLYVKLERR